MKGNSEPSPGTFVDLTTAQSLLETADETGWKTVVIVLEELIKEKGMREVLPPIDHERVEYFVKFWANPEISKPEWMLKALDTFEKAKPTVSTSISNKYFRKG
jgi:hypothetical protein